MDRFREVVENRHRYAREWKARTGGKVLGYFCCYVPEEVIYAAGILPVRIMSSRESPVLADPYLFAMYCPFSRGCLHEALAGRYDYLDGIVMARTCFHILGAFECWERLLPTPYRYYLHMPHTPQEPHAKPLFIGEIEDFKASLEKWVGNTISTEALDKAIEVYNTNRRLLMDVYRLKLDTPPAVSGTETMDMTLSSMLMDKAEHNQLLAEVLERLPTRHDRPTPGTRLMVVGDALDNSDLVRLVESLGANIVVDDLCMGTRYFWGEVMPEDDRLAAIARRYLDKPNCPTKDPLHKRRIGHVLKLAKDYGVQGIYQVQQKFCDSHELYLPLLQEAYKQSGLPMLFIELDTMMPVGQIQVRTEAFLEMLEPELV